MSKGHVTGNKREKLGSADWYKQIEADTLRRLEEAEQAAQADKE